MSAQSVKKAAVIGAGSMGHGIAQLLIMTGTDVTLVDINDEILVTGKKSGYYFDAAPEGGARLTAAPGSGTEAGGMGGGRSPKS